MNKYVERLYNGVVKENPSLVLMLGMCPTLAVTTSAINGIGMGLSTLAVLIFSNLIISLMRKIIPDQVRLPAYIVIVASLVTVVDLLLQAYAPGAVRFAWHLHPADRRKLHHSRPCRSLCKQGRTGTCTFRRAWNGSWLYGCTDSDRHDP